MNNYRVVEVDGWYEPQLEYNKGVGEGMFWAPLNGDGYWADPSSYTFGETMERHLFRTRELADRAVARAMRINGENLIAIAPGVEV